MWWGDLAEAMGKNEYMSDENTQPTSPQPSEPNEPTEVLGDQPAQSPQSPQSPQSQPAQPTSPSQGAVPPPPPPPPPAPQAQQPAYQQTPQQTPQQHPQPGYGQYPGYQPQPMVRTSNSAVWALVLAIGSFIICPLIPAVIALVLAGSAKREISQSNGWVSGEGLVTAAKVLSWINIALSVLAIVGLIAFSVAVDNGTIDINDLVTPTSSNF